MKVSASNEEELFQASGVYEPVLRELDKIIRKNAPNLKPEFMDSGSMTMLGYGITPYTYASGKTGEWPLIALAPQKNYASLYICALKEGEYYAEANKDRLGKVSCGRSCIRFKRPEDINLETVAEIVTDVSRRVAAGETLFGI
jgi:hypothetical protein